MVGLIDSIRKSVDIDHPVRFIPKKIGRWSISTVEKKSVDVDMTNKFAKKQKGINDLW